MKTEFSKFHFAVLLGLAIVLCGVVFADPAPAEEGIFTEYPYVVQVAEPAAPPHWAQELMVAAEKLPVIGPIVTKALLWLGILSGILTTLTGALLATIRMLLVAANYSGLLKLAETLVNFQNGRVMYWLRYFSMFNAKKPEQPKA